MIDQDSLEYYSSRSRGLIKGLQESAAVWHISLFRSYGHEFAERVIKETFAQYKLLIPEIPYIGGDENQLTGSLVGSVECLAFYRAMKRYGKTAAETGRILYMAVGVIAGRPVQRSSPVLNALRDDRKVLRRARAKQSQEHKYAMGYVYTFVEGQSGQFDFGYDFWECATEKFYRRQNALEFLPYFCFLDFPKCELGGLGLARSQTLGEGGDHCDFRFTEGGEADQSWPPPFLKESR